MKFKFDAIVKEPITKHRASAIWLHGLGADGNDFVSIIPELGLAAESGIRFIFPNAPVRAITINYGMPMRAWYDIRSPNLREREDTKSIAASSSLINHYIQAELDKGIPPAKIILAGFSQGGAMTLHTGLRYPEKLAGLLALSTYLPLPDQLSAATTEASRDTPIFMAHGVSDPVIPVEQGRASHQTLAAHGYSVEWNEYTMQHTVCAEEIKAIGKWLKTTLRL